jgi:hypothetical protein
MGRREQGRIEEENADRGCPRGSRSQPGSAAEKDNAAVEWRGPDQKEQTVQIRLGAGDRNHPARLEDSTTARDFAALLPLRLILKDYASTEKIADLPRRLSTEGAPVAIDPVAGDLGYYAPWGNLALFYRDGHHSPGLVRLGRVESDVEALATLEGPVTIESAE